MTEPTEDQVYRGAEAAYKRLLTLAFADDAGPVRRLAHDLTTEALDALVGIVAAELSRSEFTDDAVELVFDVVKEEANGRRLAAIVNEGQLPQPPPASCLRCGKPWRVCQGVCA